MNNMQAKTLANQEIFQALQTWGLKPQKDGDSVICGLGSLRAQCVDVQISHHGRMASLIIDLTMEASQPILLRENVMQISENARIAIAGAVHLWTISVFVAAAALMDAESCPGHMAGCEQREFADVKGVLQPWKIYSSPFMLLSNSDDKEANSEAEANSNYEPSTLPLIEPFLSRLCVSPNLYAVKTFLMDSGTGEYSGDCTVNGTSVGELLEDVKAFVWPPGQGFRSIRQYHIFAPSDFALDMSIAQPVNTLPKSLLGKWFNRS